MTQFRFPALVSVVVLLAACSSSRQADLPPAAPVVQPQPAPGVSSGGVGAAPGTEQDFMLNVGRRVFFSEGSSNLDSTARTTVRNQVAWLKANPQWKVKVQGFADDPGSEAQQKTLSQKRADAVKADMVAQGIAPDRVWAKGYGRDRLVGDCAELECKAQNRRTVTNLQDGTEPQ